MKKLLVATSVALLSSQAFASDSFAGAPFVQGALGVNVSGSSLYKVSEPATDSEGKELENQILLVQYPVNVSPLVSVGAGYEFEKFDVRVGANLEWFKRFTKVGYEVKGDKDKAKYPLTGQKLEDWKKEFDKADKISTNVLNVDVFANKAFDVAKVGGYDLKLVAGAKLGYSYSHTSIPKTKAQAEDIKQLEKDFEEAAPIYKGIAKEVLEEAKSKFNIKRHGVHTGVDLGARIDFTKNISLDVTVPVEVSVYSLNKSEKEANKAAEEYNKTAQEGQFKRPLIKAPVIWNTGLNVGVSYKF